MRGWLLAAGPWSRPVGCTRLAHCLLYVQLGCDNCYTAIFEIKQSQTERAKKRLQVTKKEEGQLQMETATRI